jgi:hypothetical protein
MVPRIRTVKPEFFRHEELYELEKQTGLPLRLAFIGVAVIEKVAFSGVPKPSRV